MPAEHEQISFLLARNRGDKAEELIRNLLTSDPDNAPLLLQLAVALAQQQKLDEALHTIRRAIQADPHSASAHEYHARILYDAHQYKDAEKAINKAIELNPYHAESFFLRSILCGQRSDWKAALAAAEEGLELDPESVNCNNARANALLYLKQPSDAHQTLERNLEKDPENSYTHTQFGWAKLQSNNNKEALEHFTEALRIDPTNDAARQGLIMALKAKNPLFSLLLKYSFFMARLAPGVQTGVVIGGFILYQIALRAAESSGMVHLSNVIIAVWLFLVFLTWAGDSFFNLLLLLDRHGRYALDKQQKTQAALIGTSLALGAFSLIGTFAGFLTITSFIGFILLCMPISRLHSHQKRTRTFSRITASLAGAGLVFGLLLNLLFQNGLGNPILFLAILLLVVYCWVVALVMKE